jgi:hypothetical protein
MPFEILHGALVPLRGGPRRERAEIAPLAGLRILVAGIEAIFAGWKLADHGGILCSAIVSGGPRRPKPHWVLIEEADLHIGS